MISTDASANKTAATPNATGSIMIVGVMFFVFGFVTWINSILIPYFKIACELTHFQSYLVAFAFYISYLVMSMPASALLKRVGFKQGMMVGFFIMSFGALLFLPAAYTRTYTLFLTGLFTIGTGLAVLQTASNPYVTILGPIERAAQRISIMGICNKTAGIVAPLLFAAVILRSSDAELFKQIPLMTPGDRSVALDELIRRVMVPYACVSVVLFGLGLFIRYSSLPEIDTEQESGEVLATNSDKTSVLQFPHLVLGALAIFFHVGSQVIAIDTVIGYASSMGVSLLEAKGFPSYILFATICGYLIGIVTIPRFIQQVNALRICTFLGVVFSLGILFVPGNLTLFGHSMKLSFWFLVALGLPNSLVWAGIWPLALARLGRFTKVGSSLMIMGLCGNAIMPLVYGYFADSFSLQQAYWVLLPCYLYLLFYAVYGHKLKTWRYS
ncbi:sugar MFS transporter [Spirosoma sp. KUDC1026]|uniref:sugar MFS transporter n=1 Tax=Spirosoma sp. KUDC1026 TaxID=2745947 RepID=UPI00159BAD3A|nr:sugar MFS transporter [Spirosoma sp. KUDC1026]QKZ13280.1 sugar MFS transporter [Spirosoma sp. KUDC1026]